MTDYTLAIFDMDKVLYDFDQRLRLRLVSELTGRPDQAIDAAVYGGPEEARAEAGDPDTAEAYLAQYAKLLGYPIDARTWTEIQRQMMAALPDVLDLVRRLKRHLDIALLTNNGMMLREALVECAPDVIDLFCHKAHVSAELGTPKPDPAIYRHVCALDGDLPEKSLFVDDKPENVDGAEAAGLTGHLFRSTDGLFRFFNELGIILR